MKYARIQDGKVAEIIEPFERVEADRPSLPEPYAGDVDMPIEEVHARAAATEAHYAYLAGEVPISERFAPEIAATIVQVPDGIEAAEGYAYDGGQFIAPADVVVALPTAEDVRAERDRRLNMTDWTQLRDVPESTAAAWGKYRQALRDVPAQSGFPTMVEWPEVPL